MPFEAPVNQANIWSNILSNKKQPIFLNIHLLYKLNKNFQKRHNNNNGAIATVPNQFWPMMSMMLANFIKFLINVGQQLYNYMSKANQANMSPNMLARFAGAFIDFIHSNFEVFQREVSINLLSVNLFFVFVV